jgi:hypothetical protein
MKTFTHRWDPGNGFVQSVSPQGADRWLTQANTNSFLRSPLLSPDGKFVFQGRCFRQKLVDKLDLISVFNYFSGKDGKDYLLGNNIIQWQPDGMLLEVGYCRRNTSELSSAIAPTQVGVTQDGTGWMLYTSPGGSSNLVWVTLADQTLGEANFEKSSAILVDQNPELVVYLCGGESFDERTAECAAYEPGRHEPLWTFDLGSTGRVQGGMWRQGQLINH